jgi:hypothetical protein
MPSTIYEHPDGSYTIETPGQMPVQVHRNPGGAFGNDSYTIERPGDMPITMMPNPGYRPPVHLRPEMFDSDEDDSSFDDADDE